MDNFLNIESFASWEYIGTFVGSVAVTALLTQFIKPVFKKFTTVPVEAISYVIAVLLINAARFFNSAFSVESFVLSFINGVLVSWVSNKAYDTATTVINK